MGPLDAGHGWTFWVSQGVAIVLSSTPQSRFVQGFAIG